MQVLRTPYIPLLALVLTALTPVRAAAQAIPGPCEPGVLPSGALSLICIPTVGWNGDLVVFAHGYVDVREPLDFQNVTLRDGNSIPLLVQSLGFAFATTSYRQNGLAILEGADDIRELVAAFTTEVATPGRTYVTGVSEGGLVAALLAERSPELFAGALAACGPIGSFRGQVDYLGDFRVLFDYYFPGVIPGSAIAIPPPVIARWESTYVPAILAALASDPAAEAELLAVAGVPFVFETPATRAQTIVGILWYNVHATNDARHKLGGNAFSNKDRVYTGSSDDADLNRHVHRFNASPRALAALGEYETSGNLTIPMVALHTVGDEIVPADHVLLYGAKVQPTGRGVFIPTLITRDGGRHCNFSTLQVLLAFLNLGAFS